MAMMAAAGAASAARSWLASLAQSVAAGVLVAKKNGSTLSCGNAINSVQESGCSGPGAPVKRGKSWSRVERNWVRSARGARPAGEVARAMRRISKTAGRKWSLW